MAKDLHSQTFSVFQQHRRAQQRKKNITNGLLSSLKAEASLLSEVLQISQQRAAASRCVPSLTCALGCCSHLPAAL